MNIQLIKGEFSPTDSLDLITHLIHVKIKFQEKKILQGNNEEDIKMREAKIKQLQKDLFEVRKFIEKNSKNIGIEGQISFHLK
jgi:hypothetical protein